MNDPVPASPTMSPNGAARPRGLRDRRPKARAPAPPPPPPRLREHLERMRALGDRIVAKREIVLPTDAFRIPEVTDVEAITLYGDTAERHDRFAGKQGEFEALERKAQELRDQGRPARMVLGVTRYNFSRLAAMATLAERWRGRVRDFRSPTLALFPVRQLLRNVLEYAEAVHRLLDPAQVSLTLADEDLYEMLWTLAERARERPDDERQVLRYLGILSEETFVGPQTIVIDPFHRCNTNCIHCWVHTPGVKHETEFLDRRIDDAHLYGLLQDAADMKTDGVILQGDGEPILDPRFPEIVEFARSRGLNLSFFTNGIALSEKLARICVELGVHEIYCSLPSGEASNYPVVCPMHPEKTFEKIVQNMARLIEIRDAAGREYPRLTMTHVLHTLSYHQVLPMARTDLAITPNVVRYYLVRLDGNNEFLKLSQAEVESIRADLKPAREMLNEAGIPVIANVDFQLDHYDERDGSWAGDVFLKKGCTIGWFFTLMPAKLDASFCCHLRTTGDLNQETYRELWFSDRYRRYRQQAKYIKQNTHVVFENGQRLWDEHCSHCDNHQTILEHHTTLEAWGLAKFLDPSGGPAVRLPKDDPTLCAPKRGAAAGNRGAMGTEHATPSLA